MSWWEDAVGLSAEITRTFTLDDVERYNQLADDQADPSQVPEPLIAGLFSTLLGVHLPGAGTNYLKQSLAFVAHADLDEALRASVEITSVRPEKRLVKLLTRCATSTGATICEGEALVLAGGAPLPEEPGQDRNGHLRSKT